mgnify:CR=1 FL=1
MPLSDIARAVEDQFHRDSVPVLKRQGWRPRVIPYDGYGTSAPAQPNPTAQQHQVKAGQHSRSSRNGTRNSFATSAGRCWVDGAAM